MTSKATKQILAQAVAQQRIKSRKEDTAIEKQQVERGSAVIQGTRYVFNKKHHESLVAEISNQKEAGTITSGEIAARVCLALTAKYSVRNRDGCIDYADLGEQARAVFCESRVYPTNILYDNNPSRASAGFSVCSFRLFPKASSPPLLLGSCKSPSPEVEDPENCVWVILDGNVAGIGISSLLPIVSSYTRRFPGAFLFPTSQYPLAGSILSVLCWLSPANICRPLWGNLTVSVTIPYARKLCQKVPSFSTCLLSSLRCSSSPWGILFCLSRSASVPTVTSSLSFSPSGLFLSAQSSDSGPCYLISSSPSEESVELSLEQLALLFGPPFFLFSLSSGIMVRSSGPSPATFPEISPEEQKQGEKALVKMGPPVDRYLQAIRGISLKPINKRPQGQYIKK